MPTFSERHGYTAEKAIQLRSMDSALRTCLWNFIDMQFFQTEEAYFSQDAQLHVDAKILYDGFHKKAVRSIPFEIENFVKQELKWFTNSEWHEAYSYCEFLLSTLISNNDAKNVHSTFNYVLEREKSGYRLIGGLITPIIEQEQLEEIQTALDSPHEFRAASKHIKTALEFYADRKTPDYRNSVKESISAIEAVAKIISGKESAVLTDALKVVDAKHPMHPAFKQAVDKLYGYTSDAKGVRHALIDETAIDEADARFMIVACSAFVSYLISRTS